MSRVARATALLGAAALLLSPACGGDETAAPPTTVFATKPPPPLGSDPATLPEITTTTGLEAGELPDALAAGETTAMPSGTAGRRGAPTTAAPRTGTVGKPAPAGSGSGGGATSTTRAEPSTARASLTPAEVTPAPGDPAGSGTVTVTVDSAAGQVCVELTLRGLVGEPDSAHVHRGPRGSVGDAVVTLPVPPSTGTVRGCSRADARTLGEMDREPQAFYVDVHTRTHPGGAVRGQLARA